MTETKFIYVNDNFRSCVKDKINVKDNNRGPKGYVEIYDVDSSVDLEKGFDKNKIKDKGNFLGKYNIEQKVGKNNLIVYQGREWLLARMFDKENENINAGVDESIYWIGFGDGGAPEEDPFNPTSPSQEDSSLGSDIRISEDVSGYADYRESPNIGYYKKRITEDVDYQQDDLSGDSYVIAEITITIGTDEANDEIINEAGLFTATSNSSGHDGPFHLFSRITFPSISKDDTRQIMFIWYVYS